MANGQNTVARTLRTVCLIMLACAGVHASASVTSSSLTVPQRIEALQVEYQRTLKQVKEGRAQLLRLEGAISILQIIESETTETLRD